jgi:hypothetical protein
LSPIKTPIIDLTTLLSRDPAFPVTAFHLHFTFYHHQTLNPRRPIETVTKWVKFVAQRGLEYLDFCVDMDARRFTKLPITILSCSTLVVLKLIGFNVEETSFSSVYLPSLKTLRLDNIRFPKLRDFILFLTVCPILEDLFTFYVLFDSEESLTCDEWKTFCLANLTRADIDCFSNHFPLKAVRNVPSLRIEIDRVCL